MNPEISKWVRVALIVLTIFLSVEALGSLKSLHDVNPNYNSISVTGEGEAISIPDVAEFSFTVSADAGTVSDAQVQVTEKMDAILSALDSFGIEENDIKTTNYSIQPKYTFDRVVCTTSLCPPSRQIQDGFTVSHSLSIKIRDTRDAGEALSIVGENGATNLSGLRLTVDDPDEVLEEARTEAIADAKEKAKMLSDELGVRLVRVVSFYDNTGGGIPYYAEGFAEDAVRTSVVPLPTIPVGENKVTVSVTIIYEIR